MKSSLIEFWLEYTIYTQNKINYVQHRTGVRFHIILLKNQNQIYIHEFQNGISNMTGNDSNKIERERYTGFIFGLTHTYPERLMMNDERKMLQSNLYF